MNATAFGESPGRERSRIWRTRQIIYLFYYENYSVRELAGIFRLSETAVKTRLKRGREKLKEQLREAWEYEE
ncbi:MAG: sigma factor-like helix-turn-helix DNA-binding protein [Lachnospiraceae bacterium]|nr:sigma factor-like helix-turn-helix DNA-binding protein [Lachnospiraceae bacterium]